MDNLNLIKQLLYSLIKTNIYKEIIFFIYFFSSLTIYLSVYSIILNYKNNRTISFLKFLMVILLLCGSFIGIYMWVDIFFVLLFFISIGLFIICHFIIYCVNKFKKMYLNKKLDYISKIYPECKTIDRHLDIHIKKYEYQDIYKINKIYKSLSSCSKAPMYFLSNAFEEEISHNISIQNALLSLVLGVFIIEKILESPNSIKFKDIIISDISIIIAVGISYIAIYIFRFFMLNIETSEMKKFNILRKYLDSIK